MQIDCRNVRLTNGFWKQKEDMIRDITVDAVWERFRESGRIDAFRFDWKEGMDRKPHIFWDSDVYKWMEGACNLIGRGDRPDLKEKVDWLIERMEEHQWEDGYFNIYFTVCEPEGRFTGRGQHELYCAGHLMEAAVSHFYATGSPRLLNVARRCADCIERVFVKEDSAAFVTPGHEEIELALVKLYQATGEERYLGLARFFLDKRGRNDKDVPIFDEITYAQDDTGTEQLRSAMGHAVRCLYLLAGMADCAKLTQNREMLDACVRMYEDLVGSKLYVTGGVGSSPVGESITVPYDLPNATAYAETCASIALVLFCDRMSRIFKDARYADTAERAMYNGMCSGISLDGQAFFYENPLEIDLAQRQKPFVKNGKEHLPMVVRQKLFDCSCCPPNLVRVLSSMENYLYDLEDGICYINHFAGSELKAGDVRIVQQTDYPWSGRVELTAEGVDELYIRIPSWCKAFRLNRPYTKKGGYAAVKNDGDKIVLEMEMKPFLLTCDPRVADNAGKAAVQCGPIVYCAEAADNCENLHSLALTGTENASVTYDAFFGGNTIELDGLRAVYEGGLYTSEPVRYEHTRIKLIPYYGFANRGESNMLVWLNDRRR